MALDGGGGGGGILGSGNQFTGTASTLEVAGEFGYGYSGLIDLNNTTQDLFSFTSGNYLFVGQFQMIFDKTQFGTGESLGFTIKLDNAVIGRLELEASAITVGSLVQPVDLILPPYGQVLITGDTDGGNIEVTGILTGRVYR